MYYNDFMYHFNIVFSVVFVNGRGPRAGGGGPGGGGAGGGGGGGVGEDGVVLMDRGIADIPFNNEKSIF